ncbi:aldo/keto reductase [Weissella confusa]|uniref:Aldo/keto reductase n=1 Tax=Weissella confusa TaxID=1583 RepID=A0A923SP11_WEICO|nr:aldo/keto reductase [Weissella confusa]
MDKHHAGLVAYGPLAEGLLTDRYLDGFPADMPLHRTNAFIKEDPEGTVAKLNALNKVAADRGQTLHLRETAEALDLMVRQGKALYVGVSNYTTEQVAEIGAIFDELHTPFIGNQMSYNMFNREVETTDMLTSVFEKDFKPYRNELVITTKAGYHMWPGPLGEFSGKKTLTAALDMSLQRMHLDYVDIFYAHRWDPNTLPYRRVADSGLILPALSFGLWRNLGDQKPLANSREVMLKAFDNGIFSFDNASNYGPSDGSAEETFGCSRCCQWHRC